MTGRSLRIPLDNSFDDFQVAHWHLWSGLPSIGSSTIDCWILMVIASVQSSGSINDAIVSVLSKGLVRPSFQFHVIPICWNI